MRTALALGLILTALILACSKPDPNRLQVPSQLAAVESCRDVHDILDLMDERLLWSKDLSFDELLLVRERDTDTIVNYYKFYCDDSFKDCKEAEQVSEVLSSRPSIYLIYSQLALDYLSENDCY